MPVAEELSEERLKPPRMMFSRKSSSRSGRAFLLVFLFLAILFSSLAIFYTGRIAAFSINHFTDYRITCSNWNGNLFGKSEIEELCFWPSDGKFTLKAKKVWLDFKVRRLFEHGLFVLDCRMAGVSFGAMRQGGPGGPSSGSILALPFAPERKYKQVMFAVFLDKNTVKIEKFRAFSRDIRLEGDYIFSKDKNEVSIDLKISFSPEMSGALSGYIEKNMLSPEKDGWYGTIVSYRGNAVLLKALYSLASEAPPAPS